MDLTGVFRGRTLNKDESSSAGSCSLPVKKWNSDTQSFERLNSNNSIVPFTDYVTKQHSEAHYGRLASAGYNELVYPGMEEDYDSDYDAESELKEEYKKRKRYLSSSAYNKEDNQLKLTDDYNYTNDFCKKLNRLFDEDDSTLSYEDEIDLMKTYEKGCSYADNMNNIITVCEITTQKATILVNAYLGKFRKDAYDVDRVTFLQKFNFKPGTLTERDI